MLKPILLILSLLTGTGAINTALAQTKDCSKKLRFECAYNPKPAKDDVLIPLGTLEFKTTEPVFMVFRRVAVPGAEFWDNPERAIRLGDTRSEGATENIFEGVQRLPINGTFYDRRRKQWHYYLGKYEVTRAQYLAIMGAEALGKKNWKLRELAEPISGLSWQQTQTFIHRLNTECYQDKGCLKAMPRLSLQDWRRPLDAAKDPPGFFRLPTEVEWEYAARGGYTALTTEKGGTPVFENRLPFPDNKLRDYAWFKPHSKGKLTRIGRFKASYGFYDLFGNVQELASGLFVTQLTQGKVGGLIARGGSIFDTKTRLRASLRRELEIYKVREDAKGNIDTIIEARSKTTGMRLAIGALVAPSERFRDKIVTAYTTEIVEASKTGTRKASSGIDDVLIVGSTRLASVSELLDRLSKRHRDSKREFALAMEELVAAEKDLTEGIRQAALQLGQYALDRLVSGSSGYAQVRRYQRFLDRNPTPTSTVMQKKVADVADKLATLNTRQQVNFAEYVSTVRRLGGYAAYLSETLAQLEKNITTHYGAEELSRYQPFIKLMDTHLQAAVKGVNKPAQWKKEAQAVAITVF